MSCLGGNIPCVIAVVVVVVIVLLLISQVLYTV